MADSRNLERYERYIRLVSALGQKVLIDDNYDEDEFHALRYSLKQLLEAVEGK